MQTFNKVITENNLVLLLLLLFNIVSCSNKEKERIIQLENDKIKLIDSIKKQNFVISKFYDSLIEIQANPIIKCGFFYSKYVLVNNSISKVIKINDEFKGKINLYKTVSYNGFLSFKMNEPTKNRDYTQAKEWNTPIVDDYENGQYAMFIFQPKDTGWYYWKGKWQIKNYRTNKNIATLDIADSIYVTN